MQWGKVLFSGLNCFEEDFENMGEERVENLAGQAVAPLHKSSAQRYEQWKRMDLAAIALETMPKQVDKAKVLDDLLKLHSDFAEDLSEEISAPELKPSVETTFHKLGDTTVKIGMETKQEPLTGFEMFLRKLFDGDAYSADFIEPQQPGSFQEFLPFSVRHNNACFRRFQM